MSNLSVVICDDNQYFLNEMCELVEAACRGEGVTPQINLCSSGTELMELLDNNYSIDILFLDVEMPDMDGIQAGLLIRGKYDLQKVLIIYVTVHKNYMPDMFQVQPHDCLIKPVDLETLQTKIAWALHVMQSVVLFGYPDGKNISYVKEDEIYCLESNLRQIKMTYGQKGDLKVITYYGKLSDEIHKLHPRKFSMPHASYIVNLAKVTNVNKRDIMLDDGRVIPISRGLKDDFMKTLAKYDIFTFFGDK